jgi:hypothetical protein
MKSIALRSFSLIILSFLMHANVLSMQNDTNQYKIGELDKLMLKHYVATHGMQTTQDKINGVRFTYWITEPYFMCSSGTGYDPFVIQYKLEENGSELSKAIFKQMQMQPLFKTSNKLNSKFPIKECKMFPLDHCTSWTERTDQTKIVYTHFFNKAALLTALNELKQ